MKKGENFNHPPKGSHITVEPIRSLRDVKKIKAMLADKPRDLALFVAGINTNLRASDLLRLKASDFLYSVPGDDLVLIEQKTHKKRRITINRAVWEAVTNWLNSAPAGLFENEGSPLFPGRGGRPLSVPSVNGLVKGWCRAAGLRGNFGSHTCGKPLATSRVAGCPSAAERRWSTGRKGCKSFRSSGPLALRAARRGN